MFKRMRKIAGCEDANCPEISETNVPGKLFVRGDRLPLRARLRRHGRRWHERDLLLDEALIDQAAEARGWRRP